MTSALLPETPQGRKCSRLVALSLPLAAGRPGSALVNCRRALLQGRPDPSPNAGVSQAAYALAADVRLGGLNHYGGRPKPKPLLHAAGRPADALAVSRMLQLTRWLTGLWLLSALAVAAMLVLVSAFEPQDNRQDKKTDQVAIQFDDIKRVDALQQGNGQRAQAGTDFHKRIVGSRRNHIHQMLDHALVVQEILTEAFAGIHGCGRANKKCDRPVRQ